MQTIASDASQGGYVGTRLRKFFNRLRPPPTLLTLVVCFLVLYPLGTILWASVGGLSANAGTSTLSLAAWRELLSDVDTWRLFGTTLSIAVPRTLLGLAIAAFFAWVVARTNTPWARSIGAALAFLFFLPDVPWIYAWTMLAVPSGGLLNDAWSYLTGSGPIFNVYSYWGLVILGAARSAPILFIFMYPAFVNIAPALEEAARMSGASTRRMFWRITIPLVQPAILAAGILSFVRSLESFEMEIFLGTPAKISVLTTHIYDLLYGSYQPRYENAAAFSMLVMVFALLLAAGKNRLLRGKSFAAVSGKNYNNTVRIDLGAWRWLTWALCVLFVLIFGLMPFIVLGLNSLMMVSGFIGIDYFTLVHWVAVANDDGLMRSILNTVIVGVGAASLGTAICALIAYVVIRMEWGGRSFLEMIVWIPWSVPGLIMALGFLWAFVSLPIYGTLWLIVLVYVARGLPIGARLFETNMVQISKELEETARVHGASWPRMFLKVWLPLLKPALVSVWILLFVSAVRVLDSAILLSGPDTRVLSVDIFRLASSGRSDQAAVLAMVQTAIVVLGYVVAQYFARNHQPSTGSGINQSS